MRQVEADDTVNHDRLMEQLRGKIRDRQVLGLIRGYLQAGVMMPDGTREATPQGVSQGGPLSPLLANIMPDPLDKELESRGHKLARYADDFVVMVKSEGGGAGHGEPDPVRRGQTQAGGQPGQKPNRAAQGLRLSGLPDRPTGKRGMDGASCNKRSATAGSNNREFPTCAHCGSNFTTGQKPESDRNRRMRTRMSGGVGPVAD